MEIFKIEENTEIFQETSVVTNNYIGLEGDIDNTFDENDDDLFDDDEDDEVFFNISDLKLKAKLEVNPKYHKALNLILKIVDMSMDGTFNSDKDRLYTELVQKIDLETGKICLMPSDVWIINKVKEGVIKEKLLSDPILVINTSTEYLNYFPRNYNTHIFDIHSYLTKNLHSMRISGGVLVDNIIKEKGKWYLEMKLCIAYERRFEMFKELGFYISSISNNQNLEKIWIEESDFTKHPLEITKIDDCLLIKGKDYKNITKKYKSSKYILKAVFGDGVKIKHLDIEKEFSIEFEGEIVPEIYEILKLQADITNNFSDYMHKTFPKEFFEIHDVFGILRLQTDHLLKYASDNYRFGLYDVPKELLESFIDKLKISAERKEKIRDMLIDTDIECDEGNIPYENYLKEINSYGKAYSFMDCLLDLDYFEIVESSYKDGYGLLKFKCRSLAYNEEDLKIFLESMNLNVKKLRVEAIS